ncbi:YdcF family protein [Mucilaginibacter glaciei]|uniref:YdcF family protein n=1 Tax=Mucilaginibacter glaciei TaxID=2772109 RepID=A0A926S4A8_9SPHI|nr:YdcF family protein [Mucilaginibacter glaciei]MBD1391601.1 YdcF family protein [Mucilaginibacter glaciei]
MLKRFLILLFIVKCSIANAQFNGALPTYKIQAGDNWVKAKNYYLLALLQQDKQAAKLISADEGLSGIGKNKLQALKSSLVDCKDGLCLPAALKFTDDEIKLVSDRLAALYRPGNALDRLVKTNLIPSGTYNFFGSDDPSALLVKAWQQDAFALNFAIGVYAEGKKPNYPLIDSISFDVRKKAYYTLMYDCSAEVAANTHNNALFFEPALNAALTYLEINERVDAGNFEPMATTVNKAAVDKIAGTKWGSFPYTHILVPGAGPDNLTTPLSGEGMLRCKAAARQYFAGKAPFIVVSGGNVHPYKTKFNEAVEMRKYLIAKLRLPASAVIIEPHARHTTTNLRNDARLAFRYGMPFNKPGLIVTDKSQNDFIMNMDKRCLKELNYVPYKLGKRLSETELEFFPLISALQIDADEPMDP